ncbi:hypothetical protein RclHR1_00600010 [Rhizophagus clarus]|uniref:Kinesin-like protein n=1 Tax=Rhizophagus clarus TaxID=94130 RepID=A0A2Z6SH65_9GLOM|nr:hypothetical protein RclHR1_00600010 [Rhizophagus clarus]
MFSKEGKTNSNRKRINEETSISKNKKLKKKTAIGPNSENGLVTSNISAGTSDAIIKEASKKKKKTPFNDVANDVKRSTAFPIPTGLMSGKASGKASGTASEKASVKASGASGKASGKTVSYKNTTIKSYCPSSPLRPITKSMAERIRLRTKVLEYKEQLAEVRRETVEIKEYNRAIESRLPKLHDELIQIERDYEEQAAKYDEEFKKLNEQCDVINEDNNISSENIVNIRKDLELKKDKIIEQKLSYESLLKQIQENYARLKIEEDTRKDLHNQHLDLKGNIRVMCRVRPYTDKENGIERANLKCSDDKRTIQVSTKRLRLWQMQTEKSTYEFDHVFDESADQNEIYLELCSLVQSAIDGYNVCIFAYGQTGSGKTYTMEGEVNNPEKKGIIPRSIDEIFDKIKETSKLGWDFKVYVQYVEIYNETIQDLLTDEDKNRKKSCKDRKKSCKESKDLCKIVYHEDTRMTIIENAERRNISKKKDMEILICKASNRRSKSSTNSNSVSSRSHGVFILHLEGENPIENMSSRGSLNLIDLAGSENIDKSGSVGDQMTEAQSINKSLFYLRNVIQQIKNKSNHVNYRDSVLTSLLKYSLGGTAKVCMLVNVSPLAESINETKKSLSFGQDARKTHVGTAIKN